MFCFIVCSVFLSCVSGAVFWPPFTPEYVLAHFEIFIQQYQRIYLNELERQIKFNIFRQNFERLISINAQFYNNQFLALTPFMDLTLAEFINAYTGFYIPENPENVCEYLTDANVTYINDAPESFDWRQHNYVTGVKDQKACNSCYAFSAVGNIEGQYKKKYGVLHLFSEQQIVDCDGRSNGCGGGFMSYAFRSLMEAGGALLGVVYPYVEEQQMCPLWPKESAVQLSSCRKYYLDSQESLKHLLLSNGPLSVAVQSSLLKDINPTGIIPEMYCVGRLDHGVLLVGYGIENGIPYWTLKNSWGPYWGEDGYFRVQRGEGLKSCGIMDDISTAVLA